MAGHGAHRVTTQVEQVGDAPDRDVPFMVGHVDREAAGRILLLQSRRRGVVGSDVAQGGLEGSEVGHGAATGEEAAAGGIVANHLRNPGNGAALNLRGGRGRLPGAGVHVDGRGQGLSQGTDHRA